MSPVMTPVVRTSMVLASRTLVLPVRLIACEPENVMPDEPVAVITASAAPVNIVTAEASTATVVAASIVFRAAADAVVSVTVMVYALPVPVSVASDETSPLEMVAVTTPVVRPSSVLAFATLTPASLRVMACEPENEIPAEPVALIAAAAVPVSVVTDAALITPVVELSRLLSAAAVSVVSESVTASLPRPLMVPAVLAS